MAIRMTRDKDPVDCHVGLRIRERRHTLRLTQAALGRTLDVTDQQIRRIEHGASTLAPSQLLRLAERLEVSVEWFLEGAAPENGAGQAGGAAEAIEIARFFRSISHDGIRRDLFLLVQAAARRSGPRQ